MSLYVHQLLLLLLNNCFLSFYHSKKVIYKIGVFSGINCGLFITSANIHFVCGTRFSINLSTHIGSSSGINLRESSNQTTHHWSLLSSKLRAFTNVFRSYQRCGYIHLYYLGFFPKMWFSSTLKPLKLKSKINGVLEHACQVSSLIFKGFMSSRCRFL